MMIAARTQSSQVCSSLPDTSQHQPFIVHFWEDAVCLAILTMSVFATTSCSGLLSVLYSA